MNARTTSRVAVLAAAALIALTGCATGAAPASDAQATAAETVSVHNAWVKAADSGMSAAFAELENSGSEDVTVTAATSAASSDLQLHETVENEAGEMTMREKDGGFVIPAGESLSLEPGGNHIMLMGLANPIKAGDELSFTLTFSDGSTADFTAPAKDYSGANESYEGDDMEMDMEMDGDH
ncbi:hypothetical protein ASC66_13495 [Leifsonia sp. Root4]|uniref:copper chaperone PCu(A)C n=1 Tax=Leifsonia sp. Root4 TaxID=1736525 RepID=UPI0006F68BE0|nr:copper chaperone PCu(A)C [Leifsonia sp. Root4]KQW04742.1 hypothetical protein ASC66_13495 [Leifsonia sp. Root4]